MEHRSNNIPTDSSSIGINSIVGNMIPDIWRRIFLTKSGRVDKTSLDLLAEIVYWHKSSKFGTDKKFSGSHLNLRYSNLISKLNVSRDTIRRSFVRLEEKGVIKRILKNIDDHNTFCSNALFIEFNVSKLKSLCDEFSPKHLTSKQNVASKSNITTLIENNVIINDTNINSEILVSDNTESLNSYNHEKNKGIIPLKCLDVYREKKERIKANSLGLSFINFENKKEEVVEIKDPLSLNSESVSNTQTSCNILSDKSKESLDIVKKVSKKEVKEEFVSPATNTSPNTTFSASPYALSATEDSVSKETEIKTMKSILKKDSKETTNSTNSSNSSNSSSFNSYKKHACYHFLPVSTNLCDDLRTELGEEYPDAYFEEAIVKMIEMDKTRMNSSGAGNSLDATSELVPIWSMRQVRSRLLAWTIREYKTLDEIKDRLGLISKEEALEAREVSMSQKKEKNYDNALLVRYEDSKDTSPIARVKRKIAGSLPREIALILLKSSYLDIKHMDEILSVRIRDDAITPSATEFTAERIRELLEPLAKSVMGEGAMVDLEITSILLNKQISNADNKFWDQNILTDDRKKDLIEESFSIDANTKKIQKALLSNIGLDVYYSWFRDVGFDLSYDDTGHNKLMILTVITDGKFKRDYLSNNYEVSLMNATESFEHSYSCSEEGIISSEIVARARRIEIKIIEESEKSYLSTKSVDKYVEQREYEEQELEVV